MPLFRKDLESQNFDDSAKAIRDAISRNVAGLRSLSAIPENSEWHGLQLDVYACIRLRSTKVMSKNKDNCTLDFKNGAVILRNMSRQSVFCTLKVKVLGAHSAKYRIEPMGLQDGELITVPAATESGWFGLRSRAGDIFRPFDLQVKPQFKRVNEKFTTVDISISGEMSPVLGSPRIVPTPFNVTINAYLGN